MKILHAVLCGPALLILPLETSAQTLHEVREVVRTYFGSDELTMNAGRRLREWGNNALQPLRALADEEGQEDAWSLVCCINEIPTRESLDLLVSILDGDTKIPPQDALDAFLPPRLMGEWNDVPADYLQNHPRFKPAIKALADSSSWLERKQVAEIAASMNWVDFVPLIRKMLDDENTELRSAAAEALSELTGRKVEIDLAQPQFTDVQLIPGLVLEPTRIEGPHVQAVTESFLLPQPDGSTVLMAGDGSTFKPYPCTGVADELRFAVPALDVFLLQTEGFQPQYVTLAQEMGFGGAGADNVISWSQDGRELWRYDPPRRGLDAAAILYGTKGPYGVAFGPGGDTGLVGFDPSGKLLWEIPKVHVLYRLRTHSRIPEVMLVIGGEFTFAHHSPGGIDANEVRGAFIRTFNSHGEDLYASDGVLYPGERGAPEAVIAGSGPKSEPVLSCFDQHYARQWKVSLTHRVTQLAMLEIEGRERLFVVTTAGGELLVLNGIGILRWRGQLPACKEHGDTHTFELVTGCSDRQAVIALSSTKGYFLYPVRTNLIPLATR